MSREPGDAFPMIVDRPSSEVLCVLKGCYITPHAHPVMTQKAALIDGLLLDATFKIIRCAVASIMSLSTCNVSVPMAFGPIEDAELYETFHRVFLELFGMDLNRYHVVCDQSSALRAVCTRHGNQQFICLRHLLLTLKRKLFSEEVGQLVRCRVQDDYDRLCGLYAPIFAVAEGSDARLLCRTLAKVGLAFDAGVIAQFDPAQ
jgi:hypothetical protein